MINNKMNDTKSVLNQYKDGKNLSTRISIYEKYGTNKKQYTTWIYENYEFFEGCEILEFGSGTGKDWKNNVDALPENSSLILSDFSKGMVEELASKFSDYENVSVMELDIQNTQIEECSKDFVMANSMLYHVPDIDKAVKEVFRVLKPKGIFYAATTGSKGMFQYLKGTLHEVKSSVTMAKDISFTLQSGQAYLERYFGEVKIARYSNKLEITDTNDLVDFIYSVASIEGLEESDREKVFEYYEQKKNGEGVIEIDIEYGSFIAKK